jgi:hypothetical protein
MPIRNQTARVPRIKKLIHDYFNDLIEQSDSFELSVMNDGEESELWEKYGDDIVKEWIQKKPGTRPSLWWAYDAPKQPDGGSGWFWEGTKPQPRRIVKGDIEDHYFLYKGIPRYSKVDPENVPEFESEAAYLKRWGLLTPYELENLAEENYKKTETFFEIIKGGVCHSEKH